MGAVCSLRAYGSVELPKCSEGCTWLCAFSCDRSMLWSLLFSLHIKRNLCEFIPIAQNKELVVSANIYILPLVSGEGRVPGAFLCLAVKWLVLEKIPIISVSIPSEDFCGLCRLRNAFRRVETSGNRHLSLVFCCWLVFLLLLLSWWRWWFLFCFYQFFKRHFLRPVCREGVGALDPTWLRGFGEAPASVNKNGFVMLLCVFILNC